MTNLPTPDDQVEDMPSCECEDCVTAARLSDVFGRVLRTLVTGRDAA